MSLPELSVMYLAFLQHILQNNFMVYYMYKGCVKMAGLALALKFGDDNVRINVIILRGLDNDQSS